MRQTLCFLLALQISMQTAAQVVAIQNDKQNKFYIGIANYITVVVAQCPYDSVQVVCKNGVLTRINSNRYEVVVDSPGLVFIEVSRKKDQGYELLDTRRYKAEYLPAPTPIYAHRSGGKMPLAEMDEGYILIAKQLETDRAAKMRYVIDSFTLMVVRNDKMIFLRRQPGGIKMDDTTLAFLKTLQVNDKLMFTGITCKGPDKRLYNLHALELIMTDKPVAAGEQEKKE